MEEVRKKIKELVLCNAKIQEYEIAPHTHLINDLGYDSIGVVQLIIEIEEIFGIEINDIYGLEQYGNLEGFIESYINFENYYMSFLGVSTDSELCNGIIFTENEERNTPINKQYVYPCIISNYKNEWYASCSKKVELELKNGIKNIKEHNYNEILNSIKIKNSYGAIFIRMIWDRRELSFDDEKIDYDISYIESLKKFNVKKEGDIVGYCKISDIYHGYGNIVIFVDGKERNKGLATYLLKRIVYKCKELGIEPIYFTRNSNKSSIRVAEKAGFHVVCQEIIYTE